MKNRKEVMTTMFRQGAKAIGKYRNGDTSLYFCPLCMNGFPESSLEDGTLTGEHVPPKSVGGKILTLTCKACNSELGYNVDAALANRREIREGVDALLKGSPTIRPQKAQFEIGGIPLNVAISNTDGIIELEIEEKVNHPDRFAQSIAYMKQIAAENQMGGEEFHLEYRRKGTSRLAKLGDLKSAFLATFAVFGYRFAFAPSLNKVREQILNPRKELISQPSFSYNIETLGSESGIAIVQKPLAAVWVWFRNDAVIMPWLNSPTNFYESLATNFSGRQNMTVSGVLYQWPTRMELRLDLFSLSR